MIREKALLLPNPHGVELGVPTEVEVGPDGTAPERIEYDGNPYRVVAGRGPAGERLYELFEQRLVERDIGPDPHLNGRGVVLSRAQRGRLLRIGIVIGGVLVLAVVGLGAVLP